MARHRRVLLCLLCAAVWAMTLPANTARAQTVVINKLDDLNFGAWSGTGNITQTSRHCVASTAAGSLFSVIITGDGPGGAFTLANGPGTLPYVVSYRDKPGSSWNQIQPGVGLLNQVGRNNPNNCTGQQQEVRVQLLASDLAAAPAGTYSGTLTLLVGPM